MSASRHPGGEGELARVLGDRDHHVVRGDSERQSQDPADQPESGLTLSEATVKTHVARIFAKLALRDRAQAVVLAYETGLVTPGGPTTR